MARPDAVEVTESGVVIVTDSPHTLWRVSTRHRTEVLYAGRRYFVAGAGMRDDRFIYFLEPWTDAVRDTPGAVIAYEDGRAPVILSRDATAGSTAWLRLLLGWLSPVLGLAPGAAKAWLDDRYGLDAVRVTRASLVLEYIGVFLGTSLLLVDLFTQVLPQPWLSRLLLGLGVVGTDLLARTNAALQGERPQPGFGEWLVVALRPRGRTR